MTKLTRPHSFQQLLDKNTKAYDQYVLSDLRHAGLVSFLDQNIDNLATADLLDLGCGAGVVSRGLSHACRQVIGIDGNPDNVALADKLAREAGIDNARFQQGAAHKLELPDQSVDVVLLNGVLEWVGVNSEGVPAQTRQLEVLREVLRVLRPGGVLYVGIENRWHPQTLRRDPHSQLPWVNAVPRPIADRIARRLRGTDYQTYIYGHRAASRLLKRAGFPRIDVFAPFPGYQLPAIFIPITNRKTMLKQVDDIDRERVRSVMAEWGRGVDADRSLKLLKQKARLGLLGLLTHDFSFLAYKR